MSWEIKRYHEYEVYQSPILNHQGLIQGFSTQSCGNLALHTGDRPETVIERRQNFLQSLGLDLAQLATAQQVHGTAVHKVTQPGSGARTLQTAIPDTDALITQVPGLVLSIFTADCLPIFLYDPDTPAIAVVHAGWRGTIDRIVELTIERMVKEYQTVPGRLQAAIGPAICKKCFQVKPELADIFYEADPLAVTQDSGTYRVDLSGFNARLMMRAGVVPERIDFSEACTCCASETFYSYRAGNKTMGRMMGIIGLK